MILVKDADGSIDAIEPSDVVHLAAAMDPGSTAGVVVYKNLSAAPFAAAARRADAEQSGYSNRPRNRTTGLKPALSEMHRSEWPLSW